MPFHRHLSRRSLLQAGTFALVGACTSVALPADRTRVALQRLSELETGLQGRLGLCAHDTGTGALLAYRAEERFPLCSTFKLLLAAAILARSQQQAGLLTEHIHYQSADLVSYSPITGPHLAEGMTVAALCAAAIQYSDNTAANLLLRLLGGPAGLTAFARALDDPQFRLDRWETELNSAIPGDPRDTSTPQAMVASMRRLLLEDGLGSAQQLQLRDWLRGNTTGGTRIRAGLPAGWQLGDKTGTGDYGSANDVAIIWPSAGAPLLLAIYTTRREQEAEPRSDVIAAASRVVVDWLAG